MNKHFRLPSTRIQIVLVALVLFSFHVSAQEKKVISVLFIGNSYTYFWNMPQVLQAMGESQGIEISTRQSTAGGTSLHQHWDGDRALKSRARIDEYKWDYVVLQNHSTSTIDSLSAFKEYGKRFISQIKESGASPLLYMTWARENNPSMQVAITSGYSELGEETETKVIPVGLIWMKVIEKNPALQLYASDGSHPSPLGTYLIALCFYKYLTGLPTVEIPNRLITTDQNGEKLYLSIVPQEDADFLQGIVDSSEN